jgi:uncharacterized protein (PEP-CTERM system associated)
MGRAECRAARRLAASFALAVAASPAAHAQRWTIEPGIGSQLTWTSNSLLGTADAQQDTVLDLRPRISVRGDGARLHVAGSALLDSITSLSGNQSSQLIPQGDLLARLEAVERWLYLEAAVRASQTSADPYGASPVVSSTSNKVTTTQTRLTPSVESAVGPLTRYRIRSDNTWSHANSASSGTAAPAGSGGYFGRHSASIEHDARPLGWRLEAERTQTRFRDGVTAPLVTDLARLIVNYGLAEDISAGLRGGYERNTFVSDNGHHAIYGGQAKWQPSARTLFSAEGERRFLGSAWKLGFDHRTPQLALNLTMSHSAQSTLQSLFELPPTNNVTGLLDAIFTTRYPDRAERAQVVQQFMAAQGLPNSTLSATSLFAKRLSLVTARGASIGFIGVRNTLVLSAFRTRTEDAPVDAALTPGTATSNNLQSGIGLSFTRRLATFVSLSSGVDWSRVQSLGAATARSTQRGLNLQLNLQPSQRTSVVFGGRYRQLDSNVVRTGHEAAVFAGLDHRF